MATRYPESGKPGSARPGRAAALDQGHIDTIGSHEELVARPGIYRDLYTLQSRAYHDGHG